MSMKHFPIFLDLKDRPCIVIGGGSVATRKVINLLTADAKVIVISPEVSDELQQLASDNKITVLERDFEDSDIAV
ncbi:MAG TPA: hypothetical protein EYG71_06480, partial [Leucothrix sp.]|nr:hypothetical protein [Leucothrix sp.]